MVKEQIFFGDDEDDNIGIIDTTMIVIDCLYSRREITTVDIYK